MRRMLIITPLTSTDSVGLTRPVIGSWPIPYSPAIPNSGDRRLRRMTENAEGMGLSAVSQRPEGCQEGRSITGTA